MILCLVWTSSLTLFPVNAQAPAEEITPVPENEPSGQMEINAPLPDRYVPPTFDVVGWAVYPPAGQGQGPGVSRVVIYAGRGCGGTVLASGVPSEPRPDVLDTLGLDPSYLNSGFRITLSNQPIGPLAFSVCPLTTTGSAFMIGLARQNDVSERVDADGRFIANPTAQFIALAASLLGLGLLGGLGVLARRQAIPISGPLSMTLAGLALIVIAGTAVRLSLAFMTLGNYDMDSYQIVASIVGSGGNVYAETIRYNYSPVWFNVIHLLDNLRQANPALSLAALIRGFLTLVDLAILGLLLPLARMERLPVLPVAAFFYLNPVSMLNTGYHGQFENFALLPLIAGLVAYRRLTGRPATRTLALWLGATLGTIIKHNIFYELIIVVCHAVRRWRIRLLLWGVALILFAATFLPYWADGQEGIVSNVLQYASAFGFYGVTSLIALPEVRYGLLGLLLVFPFIRVSRDLIRRCLLGILFFLVVTPGISFQFFVLPIALGALQASTGFVLYTVAATAYYLGAEFHVMMRPGDVVHLNVVWLASVVWFITAQFDVTIRLPDNLRLDASQVRPLRIRSDLIRRLPSDQSE